MSAPSVRRWLFGIFLVTAACPAAEKKEADQAKPATDQAKPEAEKARAPAAAELASLRAKVAQFAPAELTADVSALPPSERDALALIIEASKLLDPVFDRQAWAENPQHRKKLAADRSPLGRVKLAYFDIMRGPWDRQDHFAPFAVDRPRPPGAGFYPEDLTKSAFQEYVHAHPQQKAALEGLFTLVRRKDDTLVSVPYSEAFKAWLVPAAKKLEEAARKTKNSSLKKFLTLRAKAFLSDDYYESDKAWMDLESQVEVTIGPYETYEDKLMGYKASFESFVTVSDPEASKRLSKYKSMLPAMEANLPVPDAVKVTRGRESPIRVVDVAFTSGDARKSVQTIAFNLPNDERVRKEKGAKKVMLRNIIRTKFERILKPIGERILDESQLEYLSADAFFNEVLFHELSHSLGPAFVQNKGKTEIRMALGADYSPLEEGKADVMGAYNILFMIKKGEFPPEFREQLLVSYFAGLFRSVRFGIAESHGKGAAFQINRFIEAGAARLSKDGKFIVDLKKLEASITKLTRTICMLQHNGDPTAVKAFMKKYAVMSDPMTRALAKLDGIPVDLRPTYPLASLAFAN